MVAISDQSQEPRQSLIYVVPAGGGAPRKVTQKSPSYFHGWSPDGKTLAFCGERNGNFDVYTVPAAGGEETHALTTGELASHTHTATVTDPGHTHIASLYKNLVGATGALADKFNADGNLSGSGTANPLTGSSTTGITVANANAGSGTAHNNLQPTIIVNKIIKT